MTASVIVYKLFCLIELNISIKGFLQKSLLLRLQIVELIASYDIESYLYYLCYAWDTQMDQPATVDRYRSMRVWSDSCSAEERSHQTSVVKAGNCGSHIRPKGHAQPYNTRQKTRICTEVQQHAPVNSWSWICIEDMRFGMKILINSSVERLGNW